LNRLSPAPVDPAMLAQRVSCVDCQRNTAEIGHWYMLHDHVWAGTGLGPEDGVLCLGCLQQRLGRWLRYTDFKPTDRDNRADWSSARMVPAVWRDRWPRQLPR
jgi:hypothetical protein